MTIGNSFTNSYNNTLWQAPMMQNFNNSLWNNNNIWNNNNLWNNSFNAGFDWSTPVWNSAASDTSQPADFETVEQRRARREKEIAEAKTKTQPQSANGASAGNAQAEQAEEEAWKLLSDDYAKSLTPSESFIGAAAGGAAFGLIQNPRTIVHPINTVKGFKDTKAMFKGVREANTALNTAWKANAPVMEEAYAAMQKLASRHNSKLGLFRHRIGDKEYQVLKKAMEEALRPESNGRINIQKVAEATSALKQCYVNDGYLPRAWHAMKRFFGGKSKVATVEERMTKYAKDLLQVNKGNVNLVLSGQVGQEGMALTNGAKKILKYGKDMSYLDALKKGGGVKGGIFMAAIEFFMAKNKISAAFSKDSETGWKQVGQTSLKAAGSVLGWTAGEALGVWGAAKAGAAIGTAFGPGVGTAIGAVAGLVVGSIGCWAAGKLTHWMAGDDVGDKVLAENKSKTDEGKAELLQNAALRAQSGEIKDEKTLAAVNALASKYA